MSDQPPPLWTAGFLSALVHELRTPVASLILTSDLLAAPAPSDPTRARYARAVGDAASDLRELLEDVGDLNRLLDGRAVPQATPVALDDLLHRVSETPRPQTATADAEVVVHRCEQAPPTLVTDGTLLARALAALVHSALGARARRVEVSCEEEAAVNGGGGRLAFVVADDGDPVRAEDLPRLFAPFAVSSARTRRPYGGNGIALALAAAIATALGGELTAESDDARTRLRLALPAS
jgi:signal transduction histidine kinase